MEQPNPETNPETLTPRIYVASLSDYNAGLLHGTWIDATQDPEDIHQAVQRMLATSRQAVAEEWAIHDYEGFADIPISEYSDFETVARIAHGIKTHGDAFAAWIAYVGDASEETTDRFEEAYLGRWDDMKQYAEQYADDLGLTEDLVPEWARSHMRIDVEGMARDLEIELVVSDSQEGGVHVFNPNV